jgi:hypothetical protein
MRSIFVFVVLGLGVLFTAGGAAQDHHARGAQRGEAVMGFDQDRTAHRFTLFSDGGSIAVDVRDASDTRNRDAIRAHLPHIATMFGEGNFDAPMLVHDAADVPGTRVMAARRKVIRYRYVETPGGGRLDIFTTDSAALAAVHAFLKYQIAEHKTGDSMAVRTR